MDWLDDFHDLEDVPRMSKTRENSEFPNYYYPYQNADVQVDDRLPNQSHEHSYNFGDTGIQLRPVSLLPDIFRPIFKFGVFNAMQSQVYDTIMGTNVNIVVSAPTGSGKTVLFELAMVRLLSEEKGDELKCVYMAPTKALCSERFRDWTQKFNVLGIKCCELTGDTVEFNSNALREAKKSTIIITTPEKFDSLSRNWRDHGKFLSQIRLFLIDEVHILNDTRGSTLEVVTSRMKGRISLRFVVVSATVPNINDVAEWIGNESHTGPATVFAFGDRYRPCRLSRFVYGFPRKNQNDFSFDRSLDFRILPLLQEHAGNKPVLIFCSTRKGTVATAETLMKEYVKLLETKQHTPWVKPRPIDTLFVDQKLQALALYGIGVHHAGLGLEDRRLVEELFLKKVIQVVVATSTLAVGVNLPAHTVVVKGVKSWQNGEWREYSELDFIQMIGRAGRPQFDKEGVALILCDTEQEKKYKVHAIGQTCLESCLHHNLSEHLNSEIGLGTITNLSTAKEWLHNSFLFHRIQKNPRHYALDKSSDQTWQNRLDELVETSLLDLQQSQLITMTKDDEYRTTEYGEIMSKFYIRLITMKSIINLPNSANIREILQTISHAEEFSDLRLRAGEKQIYRKLSEHNDIRFPTKVEKAADKIFILIQVVLGGLPINAPEYRTPDSQPFLEAITVLKHAVRIARTTVEVALVKKDGPVLKAGMETIRSLSGKAWEDRPIVLRQIEQIGEKSIKVLAHNNINTLAALRKANPFQLELLLNRRPPFGDQVLGAVSELPQYCLSVLDSYVQSSGKNKPVVIELTIECKLITEDTNKMRKHSKHKSASLGMTSILTLTNELDFIDFRRIPTKALHDPKTFSVTAAFTKPSQFVTITTSPDNFAGLSVTETYKPSISAEKYPVLNTRPLSYDVDEILAGLEDDPTFWQTMELDQSDEVLPSQVTHMPGKVSVAEDENKISKKSTESQASRKPALPKLPNGNYECNHTCKRKNQCRHLCCRDGLPNPPKRSTGSAPQMNQTLLKPQPKSRNISTSHKDKNNCETSKLKSTLACSNTRSKVPSEDQPRNADNIQKFDSVDLAELSSRDEEDLPDLDDILQEAVGQNQDEGSKTQNQLIILGSTPECSPIAFSQRKRMSVSTPPHKQVKRRRLDCTRAPASGLTINLNTNNRACLDEYNDLPLFLSSSPLQDETHAIFEEDTDDTSRFMDEKAVEKVPDSSCANNEEIPLDDYAKGCVELFAWLDEVSN